MAATLPKLACISRREKQMTTMSWASTSKISVTAAPLSDGRVLAMTQADTPTDTLNSWYTKVFEESDG